MKFDDDLVEFIYSFTSVKKPIEKKQTKLSKYIISKEEGIVEVKDAFVSPGEVSESDELLEPDYWRNEIEETSNMNGTCIIEKEE